MTITVIWIALSLLGTILCAANVVQALGDLRAARAAQKKGEAARGDSWDQAAVAGVRRTTVPLAVMLIFDAVGVTALVAPGRGYGGYVIAAGLSIVNMLLLGDGAGRWLARRRLRRTVEAERAAETEHGEETQT